MKVKPEIKERIITAANALVAEGSDSPTNDQVREYMGGGSLSHISPVMREWRESRKAEVVAALEIPGDLKKVIETSVGQVWTAASKMASATVESIRQQAEVSVRVSSDERDEALSEINRLEERIAEMQKVLDDKSQIIQQTNEQLENERSHGAKLASDHAVLADRLARGDADLVARLSEKDERIKGLESEVQEARSDNKKLQADLLDLAKRLGDA